MNLRSKEFKNAISELESVMIAAPTSIDALQARVHLFFLTGLYVDCSLVQRFWPAVLHGRRGTRG